MTPLQSLHQLRKMSELVKFLFDLSRTRSFSFPVWLVAGDSSHHFPASLQSIAKDTLRAIAMVIKNSAQGEVIRGSHTSKSPPKEFIGFPLREGNPIERLEWIYLAAILCAAGFCKKSIRVSDLPF